MMQNILRTDREHAAGAQTGADVDEDSSIATGLTLSQIQT